MFGGRRVMLDRPLFPHLSSPVTVTVTMPPNQLWVARARRVAGRLLCLAAARTPARFPSTAATVAGKLVIKGRTGAPNVL